ncbi:branched-chain-amino-acid aminotransferase-like protein 2 [Patiria miniata]|uniref:Sulfotransferase family protein n=1 Tax=Patiria miniata TaxID=46514 RepID=A0A914BTE7_PATMI|nr:branched-chain-amino-acid aminotransferase-like protein 2 [Patiria miniata]
MSGTEQVRILIWCTARSLSTVLARSLSQYPGSQCLMELFQVAAYLGPERLFPETEPLFEPKMTFSYVRDLYEEPWPGKSLVLGKEVSYGMRSLGMIPDGYQHVFLIRDPAKSLRSIEERIQKFDCKKKREFYLGLNQSANLAEMYQHVTKNLGKKALVLDADDLIANPSQMLQCLCAAVGLQYTDELLKWDRASGVPANWLMTDKQWENHKKAGWFDKVLDSTGFNTPATNPGARDEGTGPSPHFQRMIAEALPYYHDLHRLRIKP